MVNPAPASPIDSIGLLICGHGSRDPQAQLQFSAWAEKLQQRTAFVHWEVGFMEIAKPTISDGARALVEKGLTHIIVIPGFIMGAAHTTKDIPAILNELKKESLFEHVRIDYAYRIANHPLLVQAASSRIQESLKNTPTDLINTHLLVVAHGSSDANANEDIVRLSHKLQLQLNIGSASAAFSNFCSPKIEEALALLESSHLTDLIILPYFIWPSYPVRQLFALADQFAIRHPGIRVTKAHCLDDHPFALDAFVDVLNQSLRQTEYCP